jgi:hypothetical protein
VGGGGGGALIWATVMAGGLLAASGQGDCRHRRGLRLLPACAPAAAALLPN